MKRHSSIAPDKIIRFFVRNYGDNLFQIARNICDIEQFIALTGVIWPNIVEEREFVFIEKNRCLYRSGEWKKGVSYISIDDVIKKFNNNRKAIERHVNTCSIPQIFWGEQVAARNEADYLKGRSLDFEHLVPEAAKILKFFWEMRVKELFPNKEILVETGMNLEGEEGLCITMYQK